VHEAAPRRSHAWGCLLLLFVCLVCCGTSSIDQDAAIGDAALDSDAPVCPPVDDAGVFVPTPMHTPKPAHQNLCSGQQSADYAACQTGNTDKCDQFQPGQASAACSACIESQITDATWGVIVFDGTKATFNIEGCVDNALGQVGLEPNSCGELLHDSYGCQDAACGTCSSSNTALVDARPDDFTVCDNLAVLGVCKPFDDKVQSTTGPCAALLVSGDATLSGAVAACFPDPARVPPDQENDWLTRIIGFICGP
jgi:hypothetical protein